LGRTLRVDHVKDYKHKTPEDGEMTPEERRRLGMNVAPEELVKEALGELSEEDDELPSDTLNDEQFADGIDPEDPMRDYLIQQRKEAYLESQNPVAKKEHRHRHRHHSRREDKNHAQDGKQH
jgi:RNA-binding motif X-linked protein 2